MSSIGAHDADKAKPDQLGMPVAARTGCFPWARAAGRTFVVEPAGLLRFRHRAPSRGAAVRVGWQAIQGAVPSRTNPVSPRCDRGNKDRMTGPLDAATGSRHPMLGFRADGMGTVVENMLRSGASAPIGVCTERLEEMQEAVMAASSGALTSTASVNSCEREFIVQDLGNHAMHGNLVET